MIPGSGRSPGGGNDNPLQYSCLGNPMTRGEWRATVHGVQRVRHDLATRHACTHTLLLFQRSKQRLTNEKHQLGLAPKLMLFPPLTLLISGVISPRLCLCADCGSHFSFYQDPPGSQTNVDLPSQQMEM